jgi:hypothetical protein
MSDEKCPHGLGIAETCADCELNAAALIKETRLVCDKSLTAQALARTAEHLLARLMAEREAKNTALRERDEATKTLRQIAEVFEAEHSQGGTEPETALTCMLQALHMLREQKRGMEDGFRTLIRERDEARAELAKHADEPHRYICPQVAAAAHKAEQERDRLSGEVERLKTQRQPMPPLDGTKFLAWWDALSVGGRRVRFQPASRFFVDSKGSPVADPTHWQPLPAPPKEQGQ